MIGTSAVRRRRGIAGAIFGDHTSPLSGTTILSSVGSGIQLIDHTTTQIPYALVCAVASLVGFIVLGFTRNITVGLLTTLAALAVAVFVLRIRFASESPRESEVGRVTG
jgi:tetracycline resistance efflux pump